MTYYIWSRDFSKGKTSKAYLEIFLCKQTSFKLMHLCNHFFPKAPSCKRFFLTVLSSLVLIIFKLELFFEKKIYSAIAKDFGAYALSKL